MKWSFITDGNYINFRHTDETDLHIQQIIHRLHNTSRCIDWSLPIDTTRISFTIDETRYENVSIYDIDFDGVQMNVQGGFETGITAMFTGLAGGGGSSSYLVYTALLTQTGTNAPIPTVLQNTFPINDFTWHYNGTGQYYIESLSLQFTVGKTAVFIGQYENPHDVSTRIEAGGNEGADFVSIYTYQAGNLADEILNGTQAITIQVYS